MFINSEHAGLWPTMALAKALQTLMLHNGVRFATVSGMNTPDTLETAHCPYCGHVLDTTVTPYETAQGATYCSMLCSVYAELESEEDHEN